MSPFLKLSFKNVFRNKRRTFITLFIMVFGVVSLFVTNGFIEYSFEGVRESTIRQGLGHIQLFHSHFHDEVEEHALQYGIENADSLIRTMAFDDDIRFAMKRIDFQGLISSGDKSAIFLGRGIEPELEEKLSAAFVSIRDGHVLSMGEGDDFEVILGTGLAKNLNVLLRDPDPRHVPDRSQRGAVLRC